MTEGYVEECPNQSKAQPVKDGWIDEEWVGGGDNGSARVDECRCWVDLVGWMSLGDV